MTEVDAALNSFTHGGTTYTPAANPSIFNNPDPEGFLLVFNGLQIFSTLGTSSTGYFPYQYLNSSVDAIYLVTNDEFAALMGDEAIIENLAVQFNSNSVSLTPGSFTL